MTLQKWKNITIIQLNQKKPTTTWSGATSKMGLGPIGSLLLTTPLEMPLPLPLGVAIPLRAVPVGCFTFLIEFNSFNKSYLGKTLIKITAIDLDWRPSKSNTSCSILFSIHLQAPLWSHQQITNYNQRHNITNSTYQFDFDFAMKILTFDWLAKLSDFCG